MILSIWHLGHFYESSLSAIKHQQQASYSVAPPELYITALAVTYSTV